jgi:Ni,Fe-hydrogenase III small subunit
MLEVLERIWRVGIVSEPLPSSDDIRRERGGSASLLAVLGRALCLRHVDAGSCNGCELEITRSTTRTTTSRGGDPLRGQPEACGRPPGHRTGLGEHGEALRRTYEATPDPKLVVAVGDCGVCGGIFGESYASVGGVAKVIPVDVTVPGCPPSPVAILQGILAATRTSSRR